MMGSVNQTTKQSKEEKLAYWREHQCKWEVSGLSRTAYCEREGLKLSSFDYQRALIRSAEMAEVNLPIDTPPAIPDKKSFLSVAKATRFIPAIRADGAAVTTAKVMVPSSPEMIHVRSPSGWQIDLTLQHITHDPGAVTSLFQLLQACR
jgi:hypothetical protein